MTTFTIPAIDHGKVVNYLWQDYQIQVVSLDAGGIPVFRISTHLYNSYGDIDKFVAALVEVISTRADIKI